jgi:thiosulfate dehydrogenase [quinone] large subunit
MKEDKLIHIPEPTVAKFLFTDTRFAWFWLLVRLYIGYEWLLVGIGKATSPVWTGPQAGTAVKGFLTGSLEKTLGTHPDVSSWYAFFVENLALPHPVLFSYLITYGEIAVGVALILGIFVGISAFFGSFMNMNFLMAGAVSSNPILLFLQLFLILAWRTAGWIGLDHLILKALGAKHKGLLPEN